MRIEVPSAANIADKTLGCQGGVKSCQRPSVCLHSPVEVSQIFAVVPWDAVRIEVPSGENTAMITSLVCPDKVCLHVPVESSQTFAVLSRDAVSTEVPSAENTADRTDAVCPYNVNLHSPVEPFQILAVVSWELVRILSTSFITTVNVSPSVMQQSDNVAFSSYESRDFWFSSKETKQGSHIKLSQIRDFRSARVAHDSKSSVQETSPAKLCAEMFIMCCAIQSERYGQVL